MKMYEMGITLALTGALGLLAYSGFTFSVKKTEKIKETSALVQQTIALSAGEDKIWSIQEQRNFLEEMPLKERTIAENSQIYFVPHENDVDVYTSLFIRHNDHTGTVTIPENFQGNIDRATLHAYIRKKTTQLFPEAR